MPGSRPNVSSRARRLVIGGGILLLVVATLGWAVSRGSPKAISYWLVDERTLGIEVIDGPSSSCGIAGTEETTTDVRITAECRSPVLSAGSTAVGYPYDLNVQLRAPLGSRVVLDALGTPAKRCAMPRCGR
jgi:hypothetical protein